MHQHQHTIPAWRYEQSCVQLLFPQFIVTPTSGNSVYYADYTLQHENNPALHLSIECKTDLKAHSTGRIFIESVSANLNSDGTLREFHVSNVLSFRYDYLVILCPSQQESTYSVLALVYSREHIPILISSAEREWSGKPGSGKGYTHSRGWLIAIPRARVVAARVEEFVL